MDADSGHAVAADTPGLAASVAAIGGLAAALSACGGGGDPAPPPAFYRTADAETRTNILAAAPRADGGRMPTATELFDWAERAYPQFFPDHRPDLLSAPYIYRYYPATGNYVGLAGTDVYVLGPLSDGNLTRVGALADFAALALATQFAFTDEAAARFLQQAQFSSTLAEIAAVRDAGYEAWLQAQFKVPAGESGWDWMNRKGYAEVDHNEFWSCQSWVTNFMLWQQLWTAPDATRKRMALALSEFFVVNVGGITCNWCHLVGATYWDILVRHAFGNFRQLLEDVSSSVAMGIFLNIDGSAKEDPATGRQPDENYAREVMQLFTIGLQRLKLDGTPQRDGHGEPVPAFTQEDVRNLARVFTGYQRDYSEGFQLLALPPPRDIRVPKVGYTRRPMVLDPRLHSTLPKNFLGVSIPANTPGGPSLQIALDTLFNHPNVGPFFGRQMIQRLVTSHPSPAYVARVAAAFNDNGQGVRGDLKAVWRAVLLDDEARSPSGLSDPAFGKLREPMVRIVQWGRTFGITSRYGYWKMQTDTQDAYQQLQQFPLRPSSVFGFFRPGYVPPGTAMAANNATAPEFQIVNESTVCSWINHLCTFLIAGGIYVPDPDLKGRSAGAPGPTAAAGIDMSVDHGAEMALIPDWAALVNRLNLLMAAGQLSSPTCQLIADALGRLWPGVRNQSYGKQWMVGYALLYVMSAPEYVVQK